MEAIRLQTLVNKDGEVMVRGLPFHKGEEIEVILLQTTKKKKLTAKQLLNSSIIGLWEERDINDSPIYARKLREQAQQRN